MITKETLTILEGYGELQFSRQEVAIIMDDPIITKALTADPKSKKKISEEAMQIRKAVLKGQLKSEAELRKSIKTQAVQGATNAQKIMLTLVEERKFEEQEDE